VNLQTEQMPNAVREEHARESVSDGIVARNVDHIRIA
jgi:hypothetical protein